MASMRPWQKSSAMTGTAFAAAKACDAGLNSMLVIGSPLMLSAPHCSNMNSGSCAAQIVFDQRPYFLEYRVGREGWHRNVQLGAFSRPGSGFIDKTRARIKRATVLVDIREEQIGIIFEAVKYTVAVMGVDIYVSNALDAVLRA